MSAPTPLDDQAIDALIAANQHHPNVEWRRIPGKGRGVFTRRALRKGEVAEWAPISVFPASDLRSDEHRDSPLLQQVFQISDVPGREKAHGWGLLALYNHSAAPNIELIDGPVPDSLSAVALRDIAAGEELCFDYGHVWFDVE